MPELAGARLVQGEPDLMTRQRQSCWGEKRFISRMHDLEGVYEQLGSQDECCDMRLQAHGVRVQKCENFQYLDPWEQRRRYRRYPGCMQGLLPYFRT